MIYAAIRFDDPSLHSNRQVEEALLDSLGRHGQCATFAVVPFDTRNGDEIAMEAAAVPHLTAAAAAGRIEVAQHGYSHKQRGVTDQGRPSELAGVSAEEQARLLERGRDQLARVFGQMPVGMVPPWNTYDRHTVEAVARLGYRYLSAEWAGPTSDRLAMVPRSIHAFDMPESIQALRNSGLDGMVVGILHHYDFIEEDADSGRWHLGEFSDLLDWFKRQDDVRVVSLAELAERHSPQSWLRVYRNWHLSRRLPHRYRDRFPPGCLLPMSIMQAARTALMG